MRDKIKNPAFQQGILDGNEAGQVAWPQRIIAATDLRMISIRLERSDGLSLFYKLGLVLADFTFRPELQMGRTSRVCEMRTRDSRKLSTAAERLGQEPLVLKNCFTS